MWGLIYCCIFLFGLLLCMIFVGLTLRLAIRLGITDKPDEQRKIHSRPMPLLGGVGMYFAFLSTILCGIWLVLFLNKEGLLPEGITIHLAGIKTTLPQNISILITSFILLATGLIDDLKKLSAATKLAVQILMAAVIFLSGIRITLFIPNAYLSALMTITWIIGITNAFNLLDNMDGLSCGTALISSFVFFISAVTNGHYFVGAILACFTGVLAGFLKYNFPPAKTFMGDAGSLFIGYVLSVLTILNTFYTKNDLSPAPIVMPLIILAVPIFDTLSVIFIRLKKGVSIFTADKNHFSHRLVRLGMSSKKAVLFIYLVNFCIGLGALSLPKSNPAGSLIILLQTICILAIIVFLENIKKCSE